MNPADLEPLIDRELRRLPQPRAPQTFRPRVMAAVQLLAHRRSQSRTWLIWPWEWQIASVTALILLIAGIAWLLPGAHDAVGAAASRWGGTVPARVVNAVQDAQAMASAVRILWRAFLPLVVGVLALVVVMGAACAACGAALGRVAWGGSHS